MGGFRAKDADRERYVDVIESAYVDGQLGEADRELRVSRALTAETLDELDALTRDLQNQPAPVVVQQTPAPRVVTPAPAPAPAAVRPTPPVLPNASAGAAPRVLGFILITVFAIVVFGMISSAQDQADMFGSDDFGYTDTGPWEPDTDVSVAEPQLTASDVRTFLKRYDAKFGTMEAYEVDFLASRVTAHVPVRGSQDRYEVWTWNGGWQRVAEAQDLEGTTTPVDLRSLDVRQLFENAKVARLGLGVSDARLQRVEVRPTPDGVGIVTIRVRNGEAHSASLETTPQGSRIREVPYAG